MPGRKHFYPIAAALLLPLLSTLLSVAAAQPALAIGAAPAPSTATCVSYNVIGFSTILLLATTKDSTEQTDAAALGIRRKQSLPTANDVSDRTVFVVLDLVAELFDLERRI